MRVLKEDFQFNRFLNSALDDYISANKEFPSTDKFTASLFNQYSDSGYFDASEDNYDNIADQVSDFLNSISQTKYRDQNKDNYKYTDLVDIYKEYVDMANSDDYPFSEWLRDSIDNDYLWKI